MASTDMFDGDSDLHLLPAASRCTMDLDAVIIGDHTGLTEGKALPLAETYTSRTRFSLHLE